MKTFKSLHIFLFLTFLSLSLVGCVDEQEDNSAPENTFLDIYDDTVWERNDFFLRLVNDTKNPFETFGVVGDPYYCLDSYQNFTQGPYWYKDLEILENSQDKLVISFVDISDPNNESPEHLEFTVTNDTLNIIRNSSNTETLAYDLSDVIFWYYEPNCGW